MPDEAEMEILTERLTDSFGHDIMSGGGGYHGETKQTEVVGAVGERCRTDCVSGENVREN